MEDAFETALKQAGIVLDARDRKAAEAVARFLHTAVERLRQAEREAQDAPR